MSHSEYRDELIAILLRPKLLEECEMMNILTNLNAEDIDYIYNDDDLKKRFRKLLKNFSIYLVEINDLTYFKLNLNQN